MEPLHKVTKQELPILYEWLKKHLPNTYKMYGTVYHELKGRWSGTRFYTLGWPEIRAVGEGDVDELESKCPQNFNNVRHLNVFGPDPTDLEELVRRPEFVDWSKPVQTQANCFQSAEVLEKLSKETGTPYNRRSKTQLMIAYPGDIKPSPVPEGFEVRPIDPQLHTAYMTSTWPYRSHHTESYIRALIESCHSVGIFDRDGNLAAFELENEYGFSSLLHVKEEYRGLGLAKCVVSLLAQKLFEENRPMLAAVITTNKPAVTLHEKLGFQTISYLYWFVHSMTSEKTVASG